LGGAQCLGRAGEIGELSPGSTADIAVWPLPESARAKNPDGILEAWLADGPAAPRHTIVQGKFVVENGSLVSSDYEGIKRRHDQITAEWQRFVDAR
jgi:cytosine/adenosine deaminase-related metal-dependent hydrolase